ILNRPLDEVLDMMAKSNSLILSKDENDNFYLEKDLAPQQPTVATTQTSRNKKTPAKTSNSDINGSSGFEITTNIQGFLSIKAFEADAADILTEAAKKLNINFFMYNKPEGVI